MSAIFSFFLVAMVSLWLTLPSPPTCSMILPHHLFFLLHLQTLLLKHEKPSFYPCFPLAFHSLSSFPLIAKSFKCSIFADLCCRWLYIHSLLSETSTFLLHLVSAENLVFYFKKRIDKFIEKNFTFFQYQAYISL